MQVHINPIDGSSTTVKDLKQGDSVRTALEKSGTNAANYSVHVNGQPAGLDKILNEDDVVTFARNVVGG